MPESPLKLFNGAVLFDFMAFTSGRMQSYLSTVIQMKDGEKERKLNHFILFSYFSVKGKKYKM